FGICKQQIGALVGGGTAGKPDGHYGGAKFHSGALLDFLEKGLLRLNVASPYFVGGNSKGVTKVEVIPPPFRDMAVVKLPKRRRGPGHSMDTIGYGADRKMGKHAAGNFTMLHCHAINISGVVEGQVSHIQRAIGYAASRLQRRSACRSQSMGNWSCPAGTGVWVVKTHLFRTACISSSLASLALRPPRRCSRRARVNKAE